jgi:hypothetical protein
MHKYKNDWIDHSTYTSSCKETVHKSTLVLKLLIQVIASPEFSLPEPVGLTKHWYVLVSSGFGFRLHWVWDTDFALTWLPIFSQGLSVSWSTRTGSQYPGFASLEPRRRTHRLQSCYSAALKCRQTLRLHLFYARNSRYQNLEAKRGSNWKVFVEA